MLCSTVGTLCLLVFSVGASLTTRDFYDNGEMNDELVSGSYTTMMLTSPSMCALHCMWMPSCGGYALKGKALSLLLMDPPYPISYSAVRLLSFLRIFGVGPYAQSVSIPL